MNSNRKCKKIVEQEQISLDGGLTWNNIPGSTREGKIIEALSKNCVIEEFVDSGVKQSGLKPLELEVINYAIELPINHTNKMAIEWGDGTVDIHDDIYSPIKVSHEYRDGLSSHIVKIFANRININSKIYNTIFSKCIRRVISWGDADYGFNGKDMTCGLYEQVNLVSVADDRSFDDLSYCFYGTKLEYIPYNLTKNATNCSGIVSGNQYYKYILPHQFDNVINFESAFKDCVNLYNIDNLYINKNVHNVKSMLRNTKIKEIKAELFKDCTKANLEALGMNPFEGCKHILEIGDRAFENCTGIPNFEYVEYVGKDILGNKELTITSPNLIECGEQKTSVNLSRNTRLLIASNNVSSLMECKNISGLPDTFLRTYPKLSYQAFFRNCSNLECYSPSDTDGKRLWELYNGIPHNNCFDGATKLQDYNEIPSDWKN